MLAKRRVLSLDGVEVERTPLLVPSFSSKGFPDIDKIVKTTEEVIEGPIVISAYDLHYKKITPPFDFASLIFLDSGGYEASKDAELSDLGEHDDSPLDWTKEKHEAVLARWQSSLPTVLISYDHPKERVTIPDQIEHARDVHRRYPNLVREILLKPETEEQKLLRIDSILPYVHSLADFDVIGVTEKEIGNSILTRMENIAKIRKKFDDIGLETPIHVFVSLDTITTPLYFLAGADVFDGLTWLRFAFHEGYTLYKHNYGALELGIAAKVHIIDGRTWFSNYRYLVDLQFELRRFLNAYDFSCFNHHSDLFRKSYQSIAESVGA